MYYNDTGKQISRDIVFKALTRLGDLLGENGRRAELVCCGGVVSVLHLGSRHMTHDVDVLFPDNLHLTELVKKLVDDVGAELGLEHGPRDKWLNDSVSFIGLQSRSQTIVFQHPHLVLKAADWHEMLAHKLTAFRGNRDISDAVHYLKEIPSKNKQEVFRTVSDYRPFVPRVEDSQFAARFDQIWYKVHGRS